jgi:ribosomal protein S18 acetylase RimI-like enzyme
MPALKVCVFDPKTDDFDLVAKQTEMLPHQIEKWPNELRGGAIDLIVAYKDEKPVGRAIVRWPNGARTTPPVLDNLPTVQAVRVNDGYRGKGCGRQIMLACENLVRARADQPQELVLTVRIINTDGQNLYKNLGYKNVGNRWERLYEKDAGGKIIEYPARCFLMVKDL